MESIEENNRSASEFVSDTAKLLQLLQSISLVTESTMLQSLINNYLRELFDAPYVLMVPLLPASEEGLIQVVNDQVLEKEIRFSVSFHWFASSRRPQSAELAWKFSAQDSPINWANMKARSNEKHTRARPMKRKQFGWNEEAKEEAVNEHRFTVRLEEES